jgi:fatty acid desaturase
MMSQRQAAFRADYRPGISPWYSGLGHVLVNVAPSLFRKLNLKKVEAIAADSPVEPAGSFGLNGTPAVTATDFAGGRLPPGTRHIPNALNAAVIMLQVCVIAACFWAAAKLTSTWALTALSAAFAVLMVSVYCTAHEAVHGILFSNAGANVAGGIVAGSLFPMPFHLLRQGHLRHHRRNRSDDDSFDLWFEGERPTWKRIQWYGMMLGAFYLLLGAANIVVLLLPFLLKRRWYCFDRSNAAFMDALNPEYAAMIRVEALAIVALHLSILTLLAIPPLHYLVLYGAFGALWSPLQYVNHYRTERHITRGARNVRICWPIDKLWLDANWHRVHHEHPTISWIHLARIGKSRDYAREHLVWAYLRMWAGPRSAHDDVQNRFAGRAAR